MRALSRRELFGSRQSPVRLPWSLPEPAFTDACTRCGDCLPACPTGIVTRGAGGYPVLDFQRGACTFCHACVDVCPEPVFQPSSEKPFRHVMQIGAACLPQHGIECRSCGDACQPAAIRFQFNAHPLAEPVLDTARCTGSGACLAVCPVEAVSLVMPEQTR